MLRFAQMMLCFAQMMLRFAQMRLRFGANEVVLCTNEVVLCTNDVALWRKLLHKGKRNEKTDFTAFGVGAFAFVAYRAYCL